MAEWQPLIEKQLRKACNRSRTNKQVLLSLDITAKRMNRWCKEWNIERPSERSKRR